MGPDTPDPGAPVDPDASPTVWEKGESERSGVYARVCPACGARFPPNFRVCPHDATPLAEGTGSEVDDPLLGQTLAGSYEITRLIGEGGMGRVYEARHTRLRNKRYAIKLMLEEFAHQQDLVARFQREAEAASHLTHPYVVAVHDVHRTDEGIPYIVEELLEGEELGETLAREGKLEVPRAVRIARQVCLGLHAAHQRGIIHRDMKPENVFLVGDAEDPVAKVLDFGISKLEDTSGENLTKTGMVIGTPAYMSPEQASGQRVDHRSDIYAVGAILYRCIAGQKPFEGMDAAATLTALLTQDPPRLRIIEPSVPEGLELVIQKAMARDVNERYQSMDELEADLAEFDPAGPLPSRSTGSGPSTGAFRPDPSARTMLAAEEQGGTRVSATAREVRFARPLLVLFTFIGYLWVVAGLVALVIDSVRWGRGPRAYPEEMAILLIAVGTVVATATPLVLWVRHLKRSVWSSSLRCVDTARRVGRILGVTVAVYGLASLGLHTVEQAWWRRPRAIFEPKWYVWMFAGSMVAGFLVWAAGQLMRRRPSR
ncbi:MAG: serine/threonine-protein kinase [Myxococcota bacterium]